MFSDVKSNLKSSIKFAKKSFIFSILIGVIVSASYIYNTTPYYTITDTAAIYKAHFKLSAWSMPNKILPYFINKYIKNNPNVEFITDYEKRNITQIYRRYDGVEYPVYSIDILNNQSIYNSREYLISNVSYGFQYGLYSIPAIFVLLLVLIIVIKIIFKDRSKDKHLRGAKLASVRKLNKTLKWKFKNSYLKLAKLCIVKYSEVKHLLFAGATGSGKSNALVQLLAQLRECSIYYLFGFLPIRTRKKGQRAIVFDDGSLVKKFYDPKRGDKILNPFDKRCVPWGLTSEVKQEPHFEKIAAAFIKKPEKIEGIWAECARIILAEIIRKMYRENTYSNARLSQYIYEAKIPDLEKLLEDTGAIKLIDEKNPKMTQSCIMSCYEPLRAIKHIPDSNTPFSIHEWVTNEDNDSWLFLTCQTGDHLDLMRSVLTYWFNSATGSLMSLEESKTRRLWFIIDELFNLDRIPSFKQVLREIRKFGGCACVCFQNFTELESIYGSQIAQGILNNIYTKVIFATNDQSTSVGLSDLLGKEEIEVKKVSYSINEEGKKSKNYYFDQKEKALVLPDELKQLDPLYGYVKLSGNYPVAKVKFKYKELPNIAKPFELVEHIDIDYDIEMRMQKKHKDKYVKPVISSYMFNDQIFVIMLSNNEKIEVDINHFPALVSSEPTELVKINLTEDKQTIIWPTLGVMLNINNIEEYIDGLKAGVFIKEFYFNNGVLVVELSDENIHIVSVDKLQCNAINKGADENLMNDNYIKDKITLSKDRKYFTWDGVDYKLDIKEIENISNSNRSISLEEKTLYNSQ